MDEPDTFSGTHSAEEKANASDSSSDKKYCTQSPVRICLVGEVGNDAATLEAAEKLGAQVVTSETGLELLDDDVFENVFVVDDFFGSPFNSLHTKGQRIFGPPALKQIAEQGTELLKNSRPLFSLAMMGLVICFTGFRKKEEVMRLMNLIHHMGGSIRKDMNSKVTHLVANGCGGGKYQYAVAFRVPVLAESWVHACWDQPGQPVDQSLHRLKPFCGARVCFRGFSEEERHHMVEILRENGGEESSPGAGCTHMVLDDVTGNDLAGTTLAGSDPVGSALAGSGTAVVRAEWFWVSVQNEGCADEKDYLFEDRGPEFLVSPRDAPGSARARKRKRLRDAARCSQSPAAHKRRSSVSDANLLSVSGSFLDSTDNEGRTGDEVEGGAALTARQMVFLELVQTETNYVSILGTIMTLFKNALEDMTPEEGPLLNATELRLIFGNLPPIFELHTEMLDELRAAALRWREDVSIGRILLRYMTDLGRAYPPFINFFEASREALSRCDAEKPRFHAFLKICQARPECGRQTLQELLIRPVQRLPSVGLLLNDILKHTAKSNPDHACLEQALSGIKEVMTHINEDKRKTESQLAMFDIFHEIDNCPPELLSSQRSLVSRTEVSDLSGGLANRGDILSFYLFSDVLEVCKRRGGGRGAALGLRSPGAGATFKHVRLVPLSHVKRVIDVRETPACRRVFALVCRGGQELKEKTFALALADEAGDKTAFLRQLCRQMANAVYKADAESFLIQLDSTQLDVSLADVSTLGKAFKFASRTRLKVGRAFSFNKTPSKLKRAVSTMMGSPFVAPPSQLTPASQLAQMRLASCSNLHELAAPRQESTQAPMSVQPTRRIIPGTQSLNAATLRRL